MVLHPNRFHLTESGPKPCKANIRDCPIGGAHFETKEKAEAAFEFKADRKFSPLGALKKKVDPFTKHIATADKRIRALSDELKARDERQNDATLWHEITREFPEELLKERFKERTNLRESGVSYKRLVGGKAHGAVGITYGGDHRTEEEYGIHHIAKSLHSGDYGPDDVQVYSEGDFTHFVVKGERAYDWNNDLTQNSLVKDNAKEAKDRYNRYSPWELRQLQWDAEAKSAKQLREELTEYGNVPKTKSDMVKKWVELKSNQPWRTPAMGEFHNGRALVITTKDPLEAKLMHKLKATHDAGSLRFGAADNGSSVFYDDRDLPAEQVKTMIQDEEASKAAKGYIAETENNLRRSDGTLFAVSTRVDHKLKDVRESRYWLNFSPRGHKQIFGNFNKEQLDRIASGDFSDVKD